MGDILPWQVFHGKKSFFFFPLEGNLSFIQVCLHYIDKNQDLNKDFEILSWSMSERPTPIKKTEIRL
jgi:hypothetical protein